jgi:organic hydroperoxide reductase OsmC/OhrA
LSTYTATIRWSRDGAEGFAKGQYSRAHTWAFDGGAVVPASPSPHIVPAPWNDPKGVDPEEAFVASLSSCHMLTFLAVACKKKFVLDEYADDAVGHMEKNENGKLAITRVELHPKIKFSGEKQPTEQELDEMHHFAHTECFIANSVKTKVTVEK